MTTAPPSTALAAIKPAFSESLALAGFLAGYRGLTREAFTLDLRKFTVWCRARSLALFSVRRADIETFARELEARAAPGSPSPDSYSTIAGVISTPSRKSSSITPRAAHVRRPRPDYESHATALDCNELGVLLVSAGLSPPAKRAHERQATYIVAAFIAGAARQPPAGSADHWQWSGRPVVRAA
jgi:integrase/recombinase XerD